MKQYIVYMIKLDKNYIYYICYIALGFCLSLIYRIVGYKYYGQLTEDVSKNVCLELLNKNKNYGNTSDNQTIGNIITYLVISCIPTFINICILILNLILNNQMIGMLFGLLFFNISAYLLISKLNDKYISPEILSNISQIFISTIRITDKEKPANFNNHLMLFILSIFALLLIIGVLYFVVDLTFSIILAIFTFYLNIFFGSLWNNIFINILFSFIKSVNNCMYARNKKLNLNEIKITLI